MFYYFKAALQLQMRSIVTDVVV